MSNSENGLQLCLNKLHFYSNKWKLKVNLRKTKLIVFNKSGRKLNINCKFGQQKVDVAKSYTYLGCVLTPSGSFSANQDQLYNKGLRALFSLLKDFHPQKGPPVRIFLKALLHCAIFSATCLCITRKCNTNRKCDTNQP